MLQQILLSLYLVLMIISILLHLFYHDIAHQNMAVGISQNKGILTAIKWSPTGSLTLQYCLVPIQSFPIFSIFFLSYICSFTQFLHPGLHLVVSEVSLTLGAFSCPFLLLSWQCHFEIVQSSSFCRLKFAFFGSCLYDKVQVDPFWQEYPIGDDSVFPHHSILK